MKRVLITGENSYIGTSVAKWLEKSPDEFEVTTISVRGDEWKKHDFSQYDTIFHVAGIAHADTGKVSEERKEMYYKVNRDLTFDVAEKYKQERINSTSQFIYMSSIIVYGDKTSLNKKRIIYKDTKPNPSNFYGDSKLQAEVKLLKLKTNDFTLSIIRPPMIYGIGSKGNYPMLAKLARKTPVFPKVTNERSMLHINNLSEFIKIVISCTIPGTLFPQNAEYISTSKLVEYVAKHHNHRLLLTPFLNWGLILLSRMPGKIGELTNKAFGNLVYDKQMSLEQVNNYQIVSFEASIRLTERV